MEMMNFTPFVRYASDHTTDIGFHLERAIYDYELIFVKEGKMRYIVEGRDDICNEGEIIFIRPGVNHTLEEVNGRIHQPHVHFDFYTMPDSKDVKVSFKKLEEMSEEDKRHIRKDIADEFPVCLTPVIRLKHAYTVESILNDLIKEYIGISPFKELMLQAHFCRLWASLCREFYWNQDIVSYKYRGDMEFIREYLSGNLDKEISLEDLAASVNISKFHLIRLFKLFYNETPMHYQSLLRLSKAKELIQYTNLSIQEISEQLGFQSIHSFSRWFKSQDGAAPTHYRSGRE